jgi:ATP-dependent RNA helicase DDX56/DBP9
MVIATPGRVAAALRAGHLTSATLSASLQMLILDEADLLLSYGYEDDLQLLAPQVPRSCQCVLMSATSSEDVERLQKLVLHSPTVLNLLDLGAGLAAGSGTAHEILHFQLQVGR